jgi:hypothetical protein
MAITRHLPMYFLVSSNSDQETLPDVRNRWNGRSVHKGREM